MYEWGVGVIKGSNLWIEVNEFTEFVQEITVKINTSYNAGKLQKSKTPQIQNVGQS